MLQTAHMTFFSVFSILVGISNASPGMLRSLSIRSNAPVYGNWCGQKHETYKASCVDDLDCACKAHIICYGLHGAESCMCDNDLLNKIRDKGRSIHWLVRQHFSASPCVAPKTIRSVKFCAQCLKVVKKCTKVPCGVSQSCRMRPVSSSKKRYVNKYKC